MVCTTSNLPKHLEVFVFWNFVRVVIVVLSVCAKFPSALNCPVFIIPNHDLATEDTFRTEHFSKETLLLLLFVHNKYDIHFFFCKIVPKKSSVVTKLSYFG